MANHLVVVCCCFVLLFWVCLTVNFGLRFDCGYVVIAFCLFGGLFLLLPCWV